MPDLRGFSLREALTVAGREGFTLKVSGVGKVAVQYPAPGSALNQADEWILSLSAKLGGEL
jgi:hypothetical protein